MLITYLCAIGIAMIGTQVKNINSANTLMNYRVGQFAGQRIESTVSNNGITRF